MQPRQPGQSTGWEAQLDLRFRATEHRTVIQHMQHHGPLQVQRPFYPEGDCCHVYLLHPPGGVVGGDQLTIKIDCEPSAKALVTTPAAGKFYRSDGRIARQQQAFHVADDALLEWLPQETILFQGALATIKTRIDLTTKGRFFGWDITCLGRPASGEGFDRGHCDLGWEIWRQEIPLLVERLRLDKAQMICSAGMARHAVTATLVAIPADQEDLQATRALIEDQPYMGVTLIDDLLVCRVLAQQAEPVRLSFTEIWRQLRPKMAGQPACLPRIWAT